MKPAALLAALIPLLASTACANLTETSDVVERCEVVYSDPVAISDATIEGDTLYLDVSYAAGCSDHYFRLCWDGAVAESEPVQVDLVLQHDANGERCEALMTGSLPFDLTPLRDDIGDGAIDVSVEGFSALYED